MAVSRRKTDLNQFRAASYIGKGIISPGAGGGVPLPSLPLPLANSAWRLPITAAVDSAADNTLTTALAGSQNTKARPSYVVNASSTRTLTLDVGAVAAPGAAFTFAVEGLVGMNYTVVAEESFNGGTTWTPIAFTKNTPVVGGNPYSTNHMRQVVRLAPGAARKFRFAVTADATGPITVYPIAVQLRADGYHDAFCVIGASNEYYGQHSIDLEAAILAAYPTRDPLVFLYAVPGMTSNVIQDFPEVARAQIGDIVSFWLPGMILGNDISAAQPISDDTAQSLIDLRTRTDKIIGTFPGEHVFPANVSYRPYSGVSPTAQADGSLPYNVQVLEPAILAAASEAFFVSLGIPLCDMYGWGLTNRSLLTDQIHYGTDGGANYAQVRTEVVRTGIAFAYTGILPKAHRVLMVEKFEATQLASDKAEAQYLLDALPASAAKTALQARVNAVVVGFPNITNPIKINLGAATGPTGWNSSNKFTVGSVFSDLLDSAGGSTGISLTLSNAGTAASSTLGAQRGSETGSELFPNTVLISYVTDTNADTLEYTFDGLNPGKTWRLEAVGSRAGTGSRDQIVTINGVATQTVSVLGNTDTNFVFTGIVPASGKIVVAGTRGAGNTVGIYFNGMILRQE